MGKHKKGWYEREEEQKVTLDSLKTKVSLTPREFELLNIIKERKLVSRNHLEIISESYRYIGKGRTSALNKSITKMFRAKILDRMHYAQELGKGNKPCVVSLDNGGSILLGLPHKQRIIQKKSKLNNQIIVNRSLPANFRHIEGVNKLESETILFCEDNGYKLVLWSHEQNNTKKFFYGQDKITLIPDVFLCIDFNNQFFYAFLEFDTGSESLRYKEPPVVRDKIDKYRKYKVSNLWLEEDWYKSMVSPHFPILLFVTEDDKRIEFFNEKSKEMGVKGIGIYHENFIDVLKKIATL